MTKVVINGCYGGFSLSTDAFREYLRRTGQEWTEKPSEWSSFGRTHFYVGDRIVSSDDIERTDPTLVAIVEEWGERADGDCAHLVVVTVSEGTRYFIDEYDGYEGIQTCDDIPWKTA